jgi:hypothetical protein
MHSDPSHVMVEYLLLARVKTDPHLEAEGTDVIPDHLGTLDSASWPVEGG